jgi:hypothetical protein
VVWDPVFEQTSCNKWEFRLTGAERAASGTMCSSWGAPFGRFVGPTNGWSFIAQSTTAQGSSQGSHFWFGYTVDIVDPLNDPNTRIVVSILEPSGWWYTVDAPPGGVRWCDSRSINLGYHPSWVGQPLYIEFSAYIPSSGASISLKHVGLWQNIN